MLKTKNKTFLAIVVMSAFCCCSLLSLGMFAPKANKVDAAAPIRGDFYYRLIVDGRDLYDLFESVKIRFGSVGFDTYNLSVFTYSGGQKGSKVHTLMAGDYDNYLSNYDFSYYLSNNKTYIYFFISSLTETAALGNRNDVLANGFCLELFLSAEPVGAEECQNITKNSIQTNMTLDLLEIDNLVLDPAPDIEHYNFVGWYLDSALTQPVGSSLSVEGDLSFYPRYDLKDYTVSFISNGGTAVTAKTQKAFTKITEPTTTREHYTFGGWFKDEALTQPYNFNSEVLSDFTLYAKWTIKKYIVTFDANGGTTVSPKTQDAFTKISEPSSERVGYNFGGWFTDAALTQSFDFDSEIAGDFTLYAKWTVKSFTIQFVTNNDETVADVVQDAFTKLAEPSSLTKYGYDFGGWFKDEAFTQPYNFGSDLLSSFTLYAKWNIKRYTLTFYSFNPTTQDYSVAATLTVDHGTTIGQAVQAAQQQTGLRFAMPEIVNLTSAVIEDIEITDVDVDFGFWANAGHKFDLWFAKNWGWVVGIGSAVAAIGILALVLFIRKKVGG